MSAYLAAQIARALDPHSSPEKLQLIRSQSKGSQATLLECLEEEIPAKWLQEVQRLYAETIS